ncbi:MAG: hypothetical protein U5N56_00150 [Candidatus Marinimicrobia bacterium]|nr:hypothetical protein [Candidatus Neomarinimicrobiota bacterium]
MAFIDDITEKGGIRLVKDNDLRDLAVRNMWRGMMLAEKHTNTRIKYCEKIKLIQDTCISNGVAGRGEDD